VSYVSGFLDSAVEVFHAMCGASPRIRPSDMYLPRTSWYTKMDPPFDPSSDGPTVFLYASLPYGPTLYGVRSITIG